MHGIISNNNLKYFKQNPSKDFVVKGGIAMQN
jgi:hypothetical protein